MYRAPKYLPRSRAWFISRGGRSFSVQSISGGRAERQSVSNHSCSRSRKVLFLAESVSSIPTFKSVPLDDTRNGNAYQVDRPPIVCNREGFADVIGSCKIASLHSCEADLGLVGHLRGSSRPDRQHPLSGGCRSEEDRSRPKCHCGMDQYCYPDVGEDGILPFQLQSRVES